ncbi:MAG: M1 family metallopeptidase [Gemmatimonadota bacterium]
MRSGRPHGLAAVLLLVALGAPVFLAPAPAAAQEPYDITHYVLDIQADPADDSLAVTATVIVSNPDRVQTVQLGLAEYERVAVRASSGPAELERDGRWVAVRLDQPAPVDTLTFELAGAPDMSRGEKRPVLNENSLFLLWSDRFYPIDFTDWALVTTRVTLPAPYDVIAPGRRVRADTVGGRVTHVFRTTHPAVNLSVFADRRWIRSERTVDGIPMVTLLHPESQRFAEQIFDTSGDVVTFFRDLHGAYPFDEFGFVTLEGTFARRAFSGFIGYSPSYLEKELTTTGHDAHETALLWWGHTVRGRGPGAFQWTEGLGDYVELYYDDARGLPYPAIFERFRREYLASPDVDRHYSELRGNAPQKLVHGRYPWLMHVLRYRIGDDAFRSAIRLLFDRYRHRTFTLDEMVAALEEGAGQPLEWWREEWLERPGVPVLSVEHETETLEDAYRVRGVIRQHGLVYHTPIDVAVRTAEGLVTERVVLDGDSTAFVVETESEPIEVVLDPERWLIFRTPEAVGEGS